MNWEWWLGFIIGFAWGNFLLHFWRVRREQHPRSRHGKRLSASVTSWWRTMRENRHGLMFRRSQGNLDAVLGTARRDDASTPRTRVTTAEIDRSPGAKVDWPGQLPRSFKGRTNPEER